MSPDTVNLLKQLLELGWPGIVTAFLCVMAYRYYQDTRDEITYLRKRIDTLETEVIQVKHELLERTKGLFS